MKDTMIQKNISNNDFERLMDIVDMNGGKPDDHMIEYEYNMNHTGGFLTVRAEIKIRQDIIDYVVSCREYNGIRNEEID